MGKKRGKKSDDRAAKLEVIAMVLEALTALVGLITILIKTLKD